MSESQFFVSQVHKRGDFKWGFDEKDFLIFMDKQARAGSEKVSTIASEEY